MKTMLLLAAGSLLVSAAFAQGSKAMYGITGEKPGETNWAFIRQLEGRGDANQTLLDARQPAQFVQARTSQKVTPTLPNGSQDLTPGLAGIAALAYDARHNRLYFAPMFREGGIRYVSLDQKKGQPVTLLDAAYNLLDRQKDGEGKNLTRMAIGANGYGYAISNDGNSFIRFGTNREALVENLGNLVDAEQNGSMSVHNACSAWGGDIIAAHSGELYLFTMRQQVFRIDPETRIATHLGSLKLSDPNFAINGAAVDEQGSVILSSATQAGKRLVIKDMGTLEASVLEDPAFLNASDLASANLLGVPQAAKTIPALEMEQPLKPGNAIGIYPNPVTNGTLTIVFEAVPKGRYQLDMISANGVVSQSNRVDVQQKGQTARMNTQRLAKGFYIIRVTNAARSEVFAQKVLVK